MKGENRLKVFEFIENSAQAIDDVFFIFTLPYGTSLGRMKHLLRKRHREKERVEISNQKQQRFRELLYHLRKDGLIEEIKKENQRFLGLTRKGKTQLEKFRLLKSKILPPGKYDHEKENFFKIVIFDIPEKERRKRNWLRATLRNLDFRMLQKSVWAGKAKLPKGFISDLDKLRLSTYVEIFAISKTGSLKQLKL